MSVLTIDRLSATSLPPLHARTHGMLVGLAERRLEESLQRRPLPDGDWYVRRLDVAVRLDFSRPDPSIEEAWAAAVVDALHVALATGSPDVVRYRHHLDALVDIVTAAAVGEFDRAWAWSRAGLLAGGTPHVESDPGAAVLAALSRHPESIVPVLVQAITRVGAARLHRLLGRAGWLTLAEVAARAAGLDPAPVVAQGTDPARRSAPGGPAARAPVPPNLAHRSAPDPTFDAGSDAQMRRARAAADTSRLAAALRRGPIQADTGLRRAWAVLALLETDPVQVRSPGAVRSMDVVAAQLTAAASVREPARLRRGDLPEAQVPLRCPTPWAGLLFLLATAADAGVPDQLVDEPSLTGRQLSWCLYAIASRLIPAAPDDPAVLAFAGLAPASDPLSRPGCPATSDEDEVLDRYAGRWGAATTVRLDRTTENSSDVVRQVALRRGEISYEPGWLDVVLDVDDVDLDVRRAGLDIDLGWVGWLGTVIRFVYV